MVHLMHGRLQDSLSAHALGWVVMLAFVAQIPFGVQLYVRGEGAWRPSSATVRLFLMALFAALIAVWLVGL
jgi:hypothetical protein